MYHLRYNIAGALGAILFVAVGFAALRVADELWDSWLFSLTVGLLLSAVLLAVHRAGVRRAYWIGFALFGWGYLGLSLIPSTESGLITKKALVFLRKTNIFGARGYWMKVVPDLDRMRAYNLSSEDLRVALTPTSMIDSPGRVFRATDMMSQTDENVVTWVGPYNKPEQYENIILLANPDGEVLRLRDVAKVQMGSPAYLPGVAAGTAEEFIRIGHWLFALLAARLGGVLSRRLWRASAAPGAPADERAEG